jgi:hypothetical protein
LIAGAGLVEKLHPSWVSVVISKTFADGRLRPSARKFYISHSMHPNDLVYTENLIEFFGEEGIDVETIALTSRGSKPELMRCLNDATIGILGINMQLDRAWIGSENFLDLAARADVPVIHWVLDHSSSHWPKFEHATTANSRFLFLSRFSEMYFRRYALPGSLTGYVTSTGVSRRSRVSRLTRADFLARPHNCLIPLNLRRVGGTLEDALVRRDSLEPKLVEAVDDAIERAYFDLDLPIETHLVAALADAGASLANDRFNFCLQIIEEVVQIRRRQWIFKIARDFPVLIQSDETATPFAAGGRAAFETNVDMKTTISRMRDARAVLNVSHVNDEIHNRTLNGLNAGCANIIEDNAVHRRLFKHCENALFFRYHDDSLRQCLDLVCTDSSRACEVGERGFRMRDEQPFRFGGFGNIVKLAQMPLPEATSVGSPRSVRETSVADAAIAGRAPG